jgi:hypothetical protein
MYGPPTDIFSFAIMTWELLTEEMPYEELKEAWDIPAFVTSGQRLTIPESIPTAKSLENITNLTKGAVQQYRTRTLSESLRGLIAASWAQRPDARPPFTKIKKNLKSIVEGEEQKFRVVFDEDIKEQI